MGVVINGLPNQMGGSQLLQAPRAVLWGQHAFSPALPPNQQVLWTLFLVARLEIAPVLIALLRNLVPCRMVGRWCARFCWRIWPL